MNDRMLLNGRIALDQMDIHFFKEMFFGRKNGECFWKGTRLTVSREQEPEVSMAMTSSCTFVESRYSSGSRKRNFSGCESP